MLLLGPHVELVLQEVVLKKYLLVNTVIGFLKARIESARGRAVPQAYIPPPMMLIVV
jgi:hypothetical protein